MRQPGTRPLIMHRTLLAILLCAACMPAAGATQSVEKLERMIRIKTLDAAGKDATSLTRDSALGDIARGHSVAMRKADALAHELNGQSPDDRLACQHRALFGLVAENVAYERSARSGAYVAERMVQGWMDSPGHRRNILADYQVFEVGCDVSGDVTYCTQLFIDSPIWLDVPVAYRQRSADTLRTELRGPPQAGTRISLFAANSKPTQPGVTFQNRTAELTLPAAPGDYRLKLWLPLSGLPNQFQILPGPRISVSEGSGTENCPR